MIEQGRNKRTVWTIPTRSYSGAHFATYPPALVEPCIKAGTSEAGRCPTCGKAWERVVEVERTNYKVFDHPHRTGNLMSGGIGKNFPDTTRNTTDWQPACTCPPHEPIPCVVFDPFAGSGTTLLVARKLGRHGVGLDLSYAYLHDQARQRLNMTALAEWETGKAAGDNNYHDLPLFEATL